jgi:hypothetical protein
MGSEVAAGASAVGMAAAGGMAVAAAGVGSLLCGPPLPLTFFSLFFSYFLVMFTCR